MSLYSGRGVSAQKEEVLAATRNLSKGLFPKAFCKIDRDVFGGDKDWVNLMHADGAGTKSIIAYLYWKETGDISVWKGIAQDAIVMNLDDLLCTGVYTNILFSSSIDRNKNRIPGEVLQVIVEGTQTFFEDMRKYGVDIVFTGGETADVGDVVRTIAVNGTMAARWKKDQIITNEKITAGNVIVGLASYGKATYENEYNSGIGSNGLTSARHDILGKHYLKNFPETFDELLAEEVLYIGKHKASQSVIIKHEGVEIEIAAGKLLLSPTRTFAPVMREVLCSEFENIYGLIHSSGGGQTKCMKYMPEHVRVVKDDLFTPPPVFALIRESSGSDDREMYQVFNMGCRMEIYTNESAAQRIINMANSYDVDARIIGRVEEASTKELLIRAGGADIVY